MTSTFLSMAKRVTDVRGFLQDASNNGSIKYTAVKGMKHLIYVPYTIATNVDEQGNTTEVREIVAISGNLHGWTTPDGKFKTAICMEGKVRKDTDGTILNDGTCPFCDRVNDGWDIYNYRMSLEEDKCLLSGTEREDYLKQQSRTFIREKKASKAETYLYLLVVQYRQSPDGNIIFGTDGLPEYDLRVMKLSKAAVDSLQTQVINSGAELGGAELMIQYPSTDNILLLYGQRTISLVFPNNMLTKQFPALEAKINVDVEKFTWDGLEKSFSEWNSITTEGARNITDALFDQWDKYKRELQINSEAKYMEYITSTPVTTPQLGGNIQNNTGYGISNMIPGVALPNIPNTNVGVNTQNISIPQAPQIPDVNELFGKAAPGIQI